jgi:hypothetical protein
LKFLQKFASKGRIDKKYAFCEVTNPSQKRSLTERGLKEEHSREKSSKEECQREKLQKKNPVAGSAGKRLRWSVQREYSPNIQAYRAPEEL